MNINVVEKENKHTHTEISKQKYKQTIKLRAYLNKVNGFESEPQIYNRIDWLRK